MPVVEDYYSKLRPCDAEDEKEVLRRQQKCSQAMARHFTMETNRRRKALEERIKHWNLQEEQTRQEILQQRRLKIQYTTENFLRAHLPPSRRRAVLSRLTLEEALQQIETTPLLFNNQTDQARTCTYFPRPPDVSHAELGWSGAELSSTHFINNQLLSDPESLQKPQEYPDTPNRETESLSSLDSLENHELEQIHGSISCSNRAATTCAPTHPHLKISPSQSRQSSNLCPTSQPESFLKEVPSQENISSWNPTRKDKLCNLTGHQIEPSQQNRDACAEHVIRYNDEPRDIYKDKDSHCKTPAVPEATPLAFCGLNKDARSSPRAEIAEKNRDKALSDAGKCNFREPSDAILRLAVNEDLEINDVKLANEHHVALADRTIKTVRFANGILKNHFKCQSANVKFIYNPDSAPFSKKLAEILRDSMELTKAKLKEQEQRPGKKKLRWFDEVDGDVEKNHLAQQPAIDRSHPKPSQRHLLVPDQDCEDHENRLTGVSKNNSNKSPGGPPYTIKPGADVGPPDRQEPIKEPTSHSLGTPQRASSAKVSSCPVTFRARKGTTIRPQSAREAQHVATTHGKILVPQPPPQKNLKRDLAHCPKYVSNPLFCEEATRGPPVDPRACPDLSPQYTSTMGNSSMSPPDARKGKVCLYRTPTDEEIESLWLGVQSALASKDGCPESPEAEPQNGPSSSQACSGLFQLPVNVRTPLRRQMAERNMLKNRGQRMPSCPSQASAFKVQRPGKSVHATGREVCPAPVVAACGGVAWKPCSGIGQCLSSSALAWEEQRILQSLERLDQCLQYQFH